MSSNKSLLRKLISLMCAASSVGLSASAADGRYRKENYQGEEQQEDKQEDDEQKDDEQGDDEQGDSEQQNTGLGLASADGGGFESMSKLFDLTYTSSAWRNRIDRDKVRRVDSILSLEGLDGCALDFGTKFRDFVLGLAGEYYDIRKSFAWSKGYVDEGRLSSMLDVVRLVWDAVGPALDGIDGVVSGGFKGKGARLLAFSKSFAINFGKVISAIRDLGDSKVGEDIGKFVFSELCGYLEKCDRVVDEYNIKFGSDLPSGFASRFRGDFEG